MVILITELIQFTTVILPFFFFFPSSSGIVFNSFYCSAIQSSGVSSIPICHPGLYTLFLHLFLCLGDYYLKDEFEQSL